MVKFLKLYIKQFENNVTRKLKFSHLRKDIVKFQYSNIFHYTISLQMIIAHEIIQIFECGFLLKFQKRLNIENKLKTKIIHFLKFKRSCAPLFAQHFKTRSVFAINPFKF